MLENTANFIRMWLNLSAVFAKQSYVINEFLNHWNSEMNEESKLEELDMAYTRQLGDRIEVYSDKLEKLQIYISAFDAVKRWKQNDAVCGK